MIRINLLPAEEKREIKGLGEFVVGVFVILAVIMLLIALNLVQSKRITNLNNKIADTKKRIEKLEDVQRKVEEFKAKNKELEDRIRAIAILEENRTGPLYVMDSLSEAIPDRAWLNKFSEKSNLAQMDGIAWDERTVADFMKRLQSSPYYQNVELKLIKAEDIQNLALKNFVIESKLNYSGKIEKEEQTTEADELKNNKAK